jgi:hypothetical protein
MVGVGVGALGGLDLLGPGRSGLGRLGESRRGDEEGADAGKGNILKQRSELPEARMIV